MEKPKRPGPRKLPEPNTGGVVFSLMLGFWLLLIMFLFSACGSFSLTKDENRNTNIDRTGTVTGSTIDSESFSVELPASILERLDLPAGVTIYTYQDRSDSSRSGAQSKDSSNVSEPVVRINYNRQTEAKDSIFTEESLQEEVETKIDKKTEVNKDSGFTWLFVGIAAGLALVIGLAMFLRYR